MLNTLVRDLLSDLLVASVAALTAPPERQQVSHGGAAHDCEQVAVHLDALRTETEERMRGMVGGPVVPVLTLQVQLLRCWPTVGATYPTAAEITAAAVTLADDAVDLSGGLLDRWAAGTLFPTVGVHADRVEVGLLEPIRPAGGFAGWRVDVDVRC